VASERRLVAVQIGVTLLSALVLTVGLAVARGGFGCERLEIASSQEKFTLLQGMAKTYDGQVHWPTAWPGRCVYVDVEQVNSGDAEHYLLDGWSSAPMSEQPPDVWAPASRAWLQLYNSALPAGRPAPRDLGTLFESPLVLAIPVPMAAALPSHGSGIGWDTIFALATDPRGWDSVQPGAGWGAFRLGKTNPHVSTSGLHALMGAFHTAGEDGSPPAAGSTEARTFAAGIEGSVLHYAPTANDFLKILYGIDQRATRPGCPEVLRYVSAIAVEEKEVTDYNQRVPTPCVQLVPLYPKPATAIADHPYLLLNETKRDAALDFLQFLQEPPQRDQVDKAGFRIGTTSGGPHAAGPSLAARTFVDPSAPAVFSPPDGAVLQKELGVWDQVRKPARVLLLVGAAIDASTRSFLADAVRRFSPQDRAGLASFSAGGQLVQETPVAVMDAAGVDALTKKIASLPSGPEGGLASVLPSAVHQMQAAYDPRAVDAIVVVDPDAGHAPVPLALATLLVTQPAASYVRVFTVGSGSTMRDLALDGDGVNYPLKPGPDFLKDVISNF
jgi:Ca-activated chloride channel family protein